MLAREQSLWKTAHYSERQTAGPMSMSKPRLDQPGLIQVAGVIDQAEAEVLVACGVRFLGFPLRLPVNAEDLTEAQAARIIRALPPECCGVLITYADTADEVLALCRDLGAGAVQLHGPIAAAELARIRAAAPALGMIKSLVVGEPSSRGLRQTVEAAAPHVDAFITDTFDPATGASGATGKTHDWAVSRDLVALSPRPVILAGGLTPDNVADAVRAVAPAGVDAHTGLEGADGRKDPERLRRFIAEAKAAFRQTAHRGG